MNQNINNSHLPGHKPLTDILLLLTPAIVIITMSPFESIDRFNGPKLVALTSMLVFVSILTLKSKRKLIINLHRADLILIAFILVSAVAIFNSESFWQTQFFGKLGRDSGFLAYLVFIFLLVLIRYVKYENRFEIFIYSLLLVALPVQIYAGLQILKLDPLTWTTPETWVFSFLGNPNHLSSFLGIVFLLNLYLIGLRRWLIPGLLNMVLILLIMTLNTSLQGFVIISVGVWILLFWQIKNQTLFVLSNIMGLVIISFLASYTLFDLSVFSFEINLLQEGTFLRRKELWLVALLAARESLFIGYGFSSFEIVYTKFRTSEIVGRVGADRSADSVHNEILELLVDGGFLLAVLWLALIGTILFKFFKYLGTKRATINVAHDPLTYIGIIFIGSTIHNLISPMSIAISSIMMVSGGLILYSKQSDLEPFGLIENEKPNLRTNKLNLSPIIAIMGVTLLALSLLPMIKNVQLVNSLQAGNINDAYRAVSGFPRDPGRYMVFARALIQDEKYGDAKFILEEVATKFPNQSAPIELLLRFRLTELERARYEFKLRTLNPLYDFQR